MQKEKNEYLRNVRTVLKTHGASFSIRHVIISDLRKKIRVYIANNNVTSFDQITILRPPQEIATDYYMTDGFEMTRRKARRYEIAVIIAIILATIVVITLINQIMLYRGDRDIDISDPVITEHYYHDLIPK